MPTGRKHQKFISDDEGRTFRGEDCRCTIAEDHDVKLYPIENFEGYIGRGSNESTSGLDVHDAADIWLSKGMDEDYTFGYSEDELRRAADL